MGLARGGLAKDAPVEFGGDAVVVQALGAVLALPDRDSVRRQLGEARAEGGIDVAFQDLRGGHDVGIGIVHPIAVSHLRLPACCAFMSGVKALQRIPA
jgi:hypothetical protein